MKARLSKLLAILIASVAVGVDGAPPAAYIPPPGGMISPGPVGGQMSPGAVGGTLSPGGFLGPTVSVSPFSNNLPGGVFSNTPVITSGGAFAPTGGTLSTGGVGGSRSSVIVAGGINTNPPGGTLSSSGVGGSRSGVIVTGGVSTGIPGGTLAPNGTGGTLTNGTVTRSANSVIVTGGSTH